MDGPKVFAGFRIQRVFEWIKPSWRGIITLGYMAINP